MSFTPADKRRKAAWAAFLFFALLGILILALFLVGYSGDPAAEYPFAADPEGSLTLLALEEHQGSVLAVLSRDSSSLLFRLDPSTGQVEAQRELPLFLSWAGLRSGTLFLMAPEPDRPELIACDPGTLEVRSRRSLPWATEKLVLFDCDSETAYCTLSDSRNVLRSSSERSGGSRVFPAELEFLGTDPEFGLCLYGGGTLFRSKGSSTWEQPFSHVPLELLGGPMLLCRDGVAVRWEEGGAKPLFQWEEPLYSGLFYCLDCENCLILSKGSHVLRCDEAGMPVESCQLSGAPLGICPSGGVIRHDGQLFYTPFSFQSMGGASPSPTPESSFSPSPSPSPSALPGQEDPPVKISGSFLILPAGSTVSQLRELFKPDTADIRDAAGRQLISGKLATGMTVGDWIVVVEGDCNGSGTVNSADLRQALALVVRQDREWSPAHQAADLNEDGLLDTIDLLLLSERITP